jgi:hypothetical protein
MSQQSEDNDESSLDDDQAHPSRWAVQLSDGRELARFLGPGARWRATRYIQRAAEALKNSSATPDPATGAV